jgi:hypothetical protein
VAGENCVLRRFYFLYSARDNIKMDLRDIGLEGMDWIHLAQDRVWWWWVVNTVMTYRFHRRQEFLY